MQYNGQKKNKKKNSPTSQILVAPKNLSFSLHHTTNPPLNFNQCFHHHHHHHHCYNTYQFPILFSEKSKELTVVVVVMVTTKVRSNTIACFVSSNCVLLALKIKRSYLLVFLLLSKSSIITDKISSKIKQTPLTSHLSLRLINFLPVYSNRWTKWSKTKNLNMYNVYGRECSTSFRHFLYLKANALMSCFSSI